MRRACRSPGACICRWSGWPIPSAAPRPGSLMEFLTKPQIALEQIRAACAAGLPRGVVLMDAGYGSNTGLRDRDQRSGAELCRWHPAADLGVAAGDGTPAAAAVVGARPSPDADA